MAKQLTAAAVGKFAATSARREIPDGGCPGLFLIVQTSGHKSFAMRFRRPSGKSGKLVLGPVDLSGREVVGEPIIGQPLTLASARQLASEVQRQRARDVDVVAEYQAEKLRRRTEVENKAGNTFGKMAPEFIKSHTVKNKGRRPRRWREIARVLGLDYPRGGVDQPIVIKDGLVRRWSDKHVASIDGHDLYSVIDECRRHGIPGLSSRGSGVSDARGRKMADALGSMFKWLKTHNKIATNPSIGSYRPDAPPARDRYLNFRADIRRGDELRWLWAACDTVGEPFGALLKVLLLTGQRLSEIARMTDDELSDDLALLSLPKHRTKNDREFIVPLPPAVREIIAGVRRIEGCEYVFSTNGRSPVSGFSKIKRRLDAAMLAEARKERGADATVPPWRLHDLRRTAATGMASIGVDPHIIEASLNHISGAKGGVAGIYNREEYERKKRTASLRWASYVEGIVSGRPANVVGMRRGKV